MKNTAKLIAMIVLVVATGMATACTKEDNSTNTSNSTNSNNNNGENNGGGAIIGNYATLIGGTWKMTSASVNGGQAIPIPESQATILLFTPGEGEIIDTEMISHNVSGVLSITAPDEQGQLRTNQCYYILNGNQLEIIGPIFPTSTIKKLNNTELVLEMVTNGTSSICYFSKINS